MTSEYRRPAPPGFLKLQAAAGSIITRGKPSDAAVTTLFNQANHFTNQQLEQQRYYGLGLMICSVARELAQPAAAEQTVDLAADSLAREHCRLYPIPHVRPGNFRLNQLDTDVLSDGFRPLLAKAASQTPPATRLLADTLSIVAMLRMAEQSRMPLGTPSRLRGHTLKLNPHILERIRTGNPAVRNIETNILGGTVNVVTTAFRTLNGLADTENPLITNHDIAQVVTARGMRGASAQSASLRIDEFAAYSHHSLRRTDDGRLHFDTTLLKQPPDQHYTADSDYTLLHIDRLACPALPVPGDVLGMVRSLLPPIVASAQTKIRCKS